MLKNIFTSSVRIKLLKIFFRNPEQQFFVRQLTRTLNEQINSIRRELENLASIGLLSFTEENRKKFYYLNQNFIIYEELKSIFTKIDEDFTDLLSNINSLGSVDFLLLTGSFTNQPTPVDLLLAGEIDRAKLESLLSENYSKDRPVRFSLLSKEDCKFRIEYNDRFILDLLENPANKVLINKLNQN